MELPDPRIDRAKRHNLADVVIMAVCAVICGADGWEDIEDFADCKINWFKSFLDLPHGIPCHDTFRRVFERLNPQAFMQSFVQWTEALAHVSKSKLIAIDGKTLRGSFDGSQSALHLVSAWCSENGMVLSQEAVRDKENEISAIDRLLELVDCNAATVTIDAIGCQTKFAEKITTQGGDYILALKANQPSLHEAVELEYGHADTHILNQKLGPCLETVDKGHGRLETRRYWLSENLSILPDPGRWKSLVAIGIADRLAEVQGRVTLDRRFFFGEFFKRYSKVFGGGQAALECGKSVALCSGRVF